jgi:hypothetical protein
MANWLTRRVSFWHGAFRSKVRAGMGLFVAAFTVLMIVRDAILDPKHKDWFLLKYAPDWPWQAWLIIGLCTLLLLTLESGFSKNRADKRAFFSKHKERLSALKTAHQLELGNARLETLITGKETQKQPEVTVTDAERQLLASQSGSLGDDSQKVAAPDVMLDLRCVDTETIKVRLDGNNRITKDERGSNQAALAYFHLKPLPQSESWVRVRAIVTLHDLDGNRKGRGKDGVWQYKNEKDITFSIGDTHALVVALCGEKVATYEYATQRSNRGMRALFLSPHVDVLEGKNFQVSVQLICQTGGELLVDETFEFSLVTEPEFRIEEIKTGQEIQADRAESRAKREYKIERLKEFVKESDSFRWITLDRENSFRIRAHGDAVEQFLTQYYDAATAQRYREEGKKMLHELEAVS